MNYKWQKLALQMTMFNTIQFYEMGHLSRLGMHIMEIMVRHLVYH